VRTWLRRLLPFVWMSIIYAGTSGLAGLDPRPCCGIAQVLFEARHIVTHLASLGLEVWLISRAVALSGGTKVTRQVAVVLGLGLALGLGQEILQTLLRHELELAGSAWDLAVDLVGCVLGWFVYQRHPVSQ
jgi:VanZ family protein